MADQNPWRFRSTYEPFHPTPFAQFRPPPPPPPAPSPWDRPFLPPPPPYDAAEYGGPYKRPRYEYAVEDERRIDLIRFHGGHAPPPPPPVGGHLPYHHQAPVPVAWSDWRPTELSHTWGGDRFSVPAPLPSPPPPPPPPPPPLPQYSHPYGDPLHSAVPAPSPPSFVGASPPFKGYVGLHSHSVPTHVNHYQLNRPMPPSSAEIAAKEGTTGYHFSNVVHSNGHKSVTIKSQDLPKKVDACHLFKHPHRVTRPDHLVVILRGLPGSGKSYLAKSLRDVEVENGGNAPRIHSMDDYFMNEVEKVEEIENSKSFGSIKEKKKITKKVMEYCYEPEMEEAYRMSMLKAFKKTLEEGVFTFIIVDDRNLRVADFAQFWAAAKTSGYEVYLLEATYKDPVGCAARNVHGFTLEDVQKMVHLWEQAPSLYLQLDVQSLLHANDFSEKGINEVDMDTEDSPSGESGPSEFQNMKHGKGSLPSDTDDGKKNEEVEGDVQNVKELGKSKWSEDVEEDANQEKIDSFRKQNALSGLMQAYTKGDKSVRWGDQAGKKGFSISASKQSNVSLIIGPGSGYNLASNPLPEEEKISAMRSGSKEVKRNAFLEHQRAECESFRAVFDRRRRRIGLLEDDD